MPDERTATDVAAAWDVVGPLYLAPPQRPAEPVKEPPWLRAIDEAMIDHHIGVADPADDYETAKRKLNILLCCAQDIGAYFAKQAEPVQEPVAFVNAAHLQGLTLGLYGYAEIYTEESAGRVPLYAAPPQRKPLSGIQVERLLEQVIGSLPVARNLIRAVEAAHGIKEEK